MPGCNTLWFYDSDFHIIEVGESMKTVTERYLKSCMTLRKAVARMGIPLEVAEFYLKL
jgi:hypothetical protein